MRPPQHFAARAIDEHEVAVGGTDGDDGLTQRGTAAHAASHAQMPQWPGIGVQRFARACVVALIAQVGGPARFLPRRAGFHARRASRNYRVDTEKARH